MRRHLVWAAKIAAMATAVMLLAWLGCGRSTRTSRYDYNDPVGSLIDELFRVHPEYRRPAFIFAGFIIVMLVAMKTRPRNE